MTTKVDLSKLSGGAKNHWLKNNRDLVLGYYEQFGREATMKQFNLRDTTLDDFLNRPEPHNSRFHSRIDKADEALAMAEMAEVGVAEARKEVRELKEEWTTFIESVSSQLVQRFFIPLLQQNITLSNELDIKPESDMLKIDDLLISKMRDKAKTLTRKALT